MLQILNIFNTLLSERSAVLSNETTSGEIKIWELEEKTRSTKLIKDFINELFSSKARANRKKFLNDCRIDIVRQRDGKIRLHFNKSCKIGRDYFKKSTIEEFFPFWNEFFQNSIGDSLMSDVD